MSKKAENNSCRLTKIEWLKRQIEILKNNLNVHNFEEDYRKIMSLQIKLERLEQYKDHTVCRRMDWHISEVETF